MLVENKEVTQDGAGLLAFVDMCEERDIRWAVSQNRDKTYKVDVLVDGIVISERGKTLMEAVHNLGEAMVKIGMQDAAQA